jgi:2-desacetyl-2-hydroxyethyl bacteriochlorophyllide A dehydrogenase
MKQIVLEQPGRLELIEVPQERSPGPGEALIEVRRIGVCGTDLHAFKGRQPFFAYPRVLGHELGVEVRAVGSGVTQVAPGDRCAVEPYLNCGRCIACRNGKPNCCAELKVLGVHVDGGMRERLVVPATKLHPSPKLSFDQLALVETLGIGAHAVARAALQPGETVAVLGSGPIGLAVIQFAVAAGARVLVVDVNPTRLILCRERTGLSDSDLIDGSSADIPRRLADLTGGDMPTAVFDATGNPSSMASAFTYPAQGGRLILVGLVNGEVSFNDPNFHRRELTVMGSRNSLGSDFRNIIGLIEAGRIDTSAWITHRTSLEETPSRFESWTDPASGVLKAMISTDSRKT